MRIVSFHTTLDLVNERSCERMWERTSGSIKVYEHLQKHIYSLDIDLRSSNGLKNGWKASKGLFSKTARYKWKI